MSKGEKGDGTQNEGKNIPKIIILPPEGDGGKRRREKEKYPSNED
jgi:hypothetical protein